MTWSIDTVLLIYTVLTPLSWYTVCPASEPLKTQAKVNDVLEIEHLKVALLDSITVVFFGSSKNIPVERIIGSCSL
jgi:hypothetical protein